MGMSHVDNRSDALFFTPKNLAETYIEKHVRIAVVICDFLCTSLMLLDLVLVANGQGRLDGGAATPQYARLSITYIYSPHAHPSYEFEYYYCKHTKKNHTQKKIRTACRFVALCKTYMYCVWFFFVRRFRCWRLVFFWTHSVGYVYTVMGKGWAEIKEEEEEQEEVEVDDEPQLIHDRMTAIYIYRIAIGHDATRARALDREPS